MESMQFQQQQLKECSSSSSKQIVTPTNLPFYRSTKTSFPFWHSTHLISDRIMRILSFLPSQQIINNIMTMISKVSNKQ
jgi:hypothetical protein